MSKKLKLELDELEVESFATHAPVSRGTVVGHDTEIGPYACSNTFNPYLTCFVGCQGGETQGFCTQDCGGGGTEDQLATCLSYGIQCPPTHYLNDTCNPTADECYC